MTGFLLVVPFRPILRRILVLRADRTMQPVRGFWLDFLICTGAGLCINFYDGVMFSVPLPNQGALMTGCIIAGFFIGLDSSLAEERRIILGAMKDGAPSFLPKRFFPTTRKFTLVALTSTFMVAVVMVLVFARDVDWLTHTVRKPEAIDAARLSIIYEIIFIMAVMMVLMVNLIFSYSRNLNLLFNNETKVLEAVRQGNLSQKVPVATGDEFGIIAKHTNHMIDGLRHRFELINSLKIAEEVQQNLLPDRSPLMKRYTISGCSIYCDQTGGDYFDYIDLGENRLGVVVADACGHGTAAAMLMTSVRAFLMAAAPDERTPERLVGSVNRHISRDCMRSSRFTTLFLLVLDESSPKLRWVRAGHEPAIVYHVAQDNFSRLNGPGLVLGVDPEFQFTGCHLEGLASGDIIFIGTDGIHETRNSSGETFGHKRIESILRQECSAQPHEIRDRITEAVADFRGDLNQEDDITLVVVKTN